MYAARLLIVLILILAIAVTFSPFASDELSQAWTASRPAVLGLMDSMYATIRNFVAGSAPVDGVDDDAPGVDFDRVITGDLGNFL